MLRLALKLQQGLYDLMYDIDCDPSIESLKEFENAVLSVNRVLLELKEETIQIPKHYLERNLERVGQGKTEAAIEKAKHDRVLTELNEVIDRQKQRKVLVIKRPHRSSDFMGWSD